MLILSSNYLLVSITSFFFFAIFKGNALKEFGRVDEAIQCYNVCLSHLSFYLLFSLQLEFLIINFMLLRKAMPCSATKPPTSSYQPREYIHGMVKCFPVYIWCYLIVVIYLTSFRYDL